MTPLEIDLRLIIIAMIKALKFNGAFMTAKSMEDKFNEALKKHGKINYV